MSDFHKSIIKAMASYPTPFYLYEYNKIIANIRSYKQAMVCKNKVNICFAMKSNHNPTIIQTMANNGLGADIVSGGELRHAISCGIPASKIVFSGIGKTDQAINLALQHKIKQINVESLEEIIRINNLAKLKGIIAKVGIRLNPDVDANTHSKITTGKEDNKFGIPWQWKDQAVKLCMDCENVEFVGIAVHIGSQITTLKPFNDAYHKVFQYVSDGLNKQGIKCATVDIGGGLGVDYHKNGQKISIKQYSELVASVIAKYNYKGEIIIEPGRSLIADAGYLVTRIIALKQGISKNFAICDAGMNDLLRPALYDAYHHITAIDNDDNQTSKTYDVVGPICESSDVFAKNITLPELQEGSALLIHDAGAYGHVMASSYNCRFIPAEIMLGDDNNSQALKVVRGAIDLIGLS